MLLFFLDKFMSVIKFVIEIVIAHTPPSDYEYLKLLAISTLFLKAENAMKQKFVETEAAGSPHAERQDWMQVLSCSKADELKSAWDRASDLNVVACEVIRKPERGLVMVRGRAGSAGEQFNLGEMTVTRCAVRTEEGHTGVSYISGRDLEQALIAAKVDALLQSEAHHQKALDEVISPLKAKMATAEAERASKVAATRVNFFTMVRKREDKK